MPALGLGIGLHARRQRSSWSPLELPGIVNLSHPKNALNAISPDTPATPGQTVRRIHDPATGWHADQATGNRQPVLGYLVPPEGNLIYFSEPYYTGNSNTGWRAQQAAVTNHPDPGPNGETVIEVDYSSIIDLWAGPIVRIPAGLPSERYRVSIWLRTVSGVGEVMVRVSNGYSTYASIDDTWRLYALDASAHHYDTDGNFIICTSPTDPSPNLLVGRVSVTRAAWSSEYVETTGTPVIPDTTGLAPALVYDGDNDMLTTTGRVYGVKQTKWAVISPPAPAQWQCANYFGSNWNILGTSGLVYSDQSQLRIEQYGAGGQGIHQTGVYTPTAPIRVIYQTGATAADAKMWINGEQVALTSSGASVFADNPSAMSYFLGMRNADSPYKGSIGISGMATEHFDAAQIAALDNYLKRESKL